LRIFFFQEQYIKHDVIACLADRKRNDVYRVEFLSKHLVATTTGITHQAAHDNPGHVPSTSAANSTLFFKVLDGRYKFEQPIAKLVDHE
jgi:hypothetical protein